MSSDLVRNVARVDTSYMSTTTHIPELTLGRRLFLARDDAGLNQAEFANRIGVSRRSVVNYESGATHPGRPVLLSWSLATGVPLEWFEEAPDYSPRIHALDNLAQMTLFACAA